MACNEILTPQQKYPQIGNPTRQTQNFLTPPPRHKHLPPPPHLRLDMAASAFFTHGYFQQANVHNSEAIIID